MGARPGSTTTFSSTPTGPGWRRSSPRRRSTGRSGVSGRRDAREFPGAVVTGLLRKYFDPMRLPYFFGSNTPLLLAPMAGVSEAPFRQICRQMGADVVLSEFLSSEAIRRRIKNTLEGAEFEP